MAKIRRESVLSGLGRRMLLGPLLLLAACTGTISTPERTEGPLVVEPGQAQLKLLTQAQYENVLADVFGDAVVLISALPDDKVVGGFETVGASGDQATVGELSFQRYERAAQAVAEQVVGIESVRSRVVPCDATGAADQACMETVVRGVAEQLFRRPLTNAELERYTQLGLAGAAQESSFDSGVTLAVSALLQSPYFLYRVELAVSDADAPGGHSYDNYEMASRLSFFLWNSSPDSELLAAAARGELTEDEGLLTQTERLMASPKFRRGVQNLFAELLDLGDLDKLSKLPAVYPQMSPELGSDARRETLLLIEDTVVDQDGDYRELFTTRRTFLNRRLAALYQVPAPSLEGFGPVTLPADGPRAGILTHTSFLALKSKPASTSAVLRGRFVRETLLCGRIPDPPTTVDLEAILNSTAPTLRQRTESHLTAPACAACHKAMDPIGFGLERFDGLGQQRKQENGVDIDPSGELDGIPFSDARGLGEAIAQNPGLGPCLARGVYRYAKAAVESKGENDEIERLSTQFEEDGFSVKSLMRNVALSAGFRSASEEN